MSGSPPLLWDLLATLTGALSGVIPWQMAYNQIRLLPCGVLTTSASLVLQSGIGYCFRDEAPQGLHTEPGHPGLRPFWAAGTYLQTDLDLVSIRRALFLLSAWEGDT